MDPYSRRSWLWLALLFIVLYGMDLAVPRDLWVQDEARYGEVVREMVEEGHWLVPHLNGHPYPDKPPLYFWLVAGVGTVVGQGELAFRLVSVGATAIAAVGTWWLGRGLLGAVGGIWAAALFLSSFLTLMVGHIVRMDMLLTGAVAFAWLGLLRCREGWGSGLFWLATAVGIAVKGPIALLFTLLPALVWLIWEDGKGGLKRLKPWLGIAGLLVLVIGWIGAVELAGYTSYLSLIWNEQLVGRAVNSWSHKEPIWFYWVLLPLVAGPWTGLILQGYRQLNPLWVKRMVVTFTLPPLIALSLVSGKLFIYLEPIFPGLAIFAAAGAVNLTGRIHYGLAASVAFLPILLGLGVAYGAHRYLAGAEPWGIVVGLGVLGLVPWVGRNRPRWLHHQVAMMVLLNTLVFTALSPLVNPLFSARALGENLASLAPEVPVAVVHTTRGVLNYYAGRRFDEMSADQIPAWWLTHPQGIVISPDMPQNWPATMRIRGRFTVELKQYYVLDNSG